MKKKIFHFIVFITFISAIAVLFYLYFFCYQLHLIKKSFSDFSSDEITTPYVFSITDTKIKMTSWNSPEAILEITIKNSGSKATNRYDNVSLTLVNIRTDYPVTVGVETDTTKWSASDETTVEIPITLQNLAFGQYELYFMVWDDYNASPVIFTNDLSLTSYGYYFGSLSISHLIF